MLLLPRVLPILLLQGAQLALLGAVQPALRLQLLQTLRLRGVGIPLRQVVLPRVLSFGSLKLLQLAPVGAGQPVLRLQLLQARVLDGGGVRRRGLRLHVLLGC